MRIAERLETLVVEGSFAEHDGGLESVDPLGFVDSKAYPDRLAQARTTTGAAEDACKVPKMREPEGRVRWVSGDEERTFATLTV